MKNKLINRQWLTLALAMLVYGCVSTSIGVGPVRIPVSIGGNDVKKAPKPQPQTNADSEEEADEEAPEDTATDEQAEEDSGPGL